MPAVKTLPTTCRLFSPEPDPSPPPAQLTFAAPERQRIVNPLASIGARIASQYADRQVSDADKAAALTEMTVRMFYEKWMLPGRKKRVADGDLDEKTLRIDRDAMKWLSDTGIPDEWPEFEPWDGLPIGCYTTGWLVALAEETIAAGPSVHTVGKYLRHLRTMFNDAHRIGLIPKLHVNIPTDEPEARPFSDEEVPLIYRALASSPALQVAFVLALGTGMRFSDLFWVRWSDIDLDKRLIDFVSVKTGKRQIVPLTDVPILHLQRLPRSEDPFASLVDLSQPPVWRASHYRSKQVNLRWRVLTGYESPPRLKRDRPADCVPHPWHSARSTAGIWLERQKAGSASRLLGHTIAREGEQTTQRHYLVPLVPRDLREAAEAVEWPECFRDISEPTRPRQRTLFT